MAQEGPWFDLFAVCLPWLCPGAAALKASPGAHESPKTAPTDAQDDPQELLTARPGAQ